jgi:starch synthase
MGPDSLEGMRVVFASAELAPLVRVGGLAEAAGGLTFALRRAGVKVEVVVPDYGGEGQPELADEVIEYLNLPEWVGGAWCRRGHLAGFGDITLVTVPGIQRSNPYGEPGSAGWHDNDRRFFAFSAAVAAIVEARGADLVHCNDWHTAPTLALVAPKIATVLSLHNLAYQGQCHIGWLDVLGEHGADRAQAYARHGECNPLAGGLQLADAVVAVSPNYAAEILTPEHAAGLDDILQARAGAVKGILNGIDIGAWSPHSDPLIPANYRQPDLRGGESTGKAKCRRALREELDLPQVEGPLIGFVTRLVDQKGVDFVIKAARYLDGIDGQLVVLGAGDAALSMSLRQLQAARPERVAFREAFDLGLAHRIFAGCDLYVMPSRFEPCGLAQMQAMAYGTIPVVTDVGGLHDTVIDADANPEYGNGFVSVHISAAGLVDALHRATRAWLLKKRRAQIIRNGMSTDWSWAGPAQQYVELYSSLVGAEKPKK